MSLCVISCLYGIVAARCEIFPYTTVRDAVLAARALVEVYGATATVQVDEVLAGPTVRNYAEVEDDTHFLISGGLGRLPEESSTGSTLAWIMDRSGRIKHVWEYDQAIWNDLEWVKAAPLSAEVVPIGLHLYEDGSLLVSFHGLHTWPYAVGLAKFDKDSRMLWKKELFNHHWFTVAEDGRIYAASMRLIDAPLKMGDTAARIESHFGKISDDTVMILDAQGNVLDEISILEALMDAGWYGLYQGASYENIDAFTPDPIHLNDVRLVTADLAQRHEWLSEGDVLVSLRGINTVGILDTTTKRFKWLSTGATVRQHSPRFFEDGVLILDNRGGSTASGGSRLVHVDLETRLPKTLFPRPSVPLPENSFFTRLAGHVDVLPPDRALVALTEAGDVWEVDLETGRVLWRYTYVDPETRQRLDVYTAKYIRNIDFPMNREQEANR